MRQIWIELELIIGKCADFGNRMKFMEVLKKLIKINISMSKRLQRGDRQLALSLK